MMGSNLIVIFSSTVSFKGDLLKVKAALGLIPDYARFSLLWLIHKTVADQNVLLDESTITQALINEVAT